MKSFVYILWKLLDLLDSNDGQSQSNNPKWPRNGVIFENYSVSTSSDISLTLHDFFKPASYPEVVISSIDVHYQPLVLGTLKSF